MRDGLMTGIDVLPLLEKKRNTGDFGKIRAWRRDFKGQGCRRGLIFLSAALVKQQCRKGQRPYKGENEGKFLLVKHQHQRKVAGGGAAKVEGEAGYQHIGFPPLLVAPDEPACGEAEGGAPKGEGQIGDDDGRARAGGLVVHVCCSPLVACQKQRPLNEAGELRTV